MKNANEIIHEATQILQPCFDSPLTVTHVDYLSEPDRRNTVLRIHLNHNSHQTPNTVILKQSLPQENDADDVEAFARFARDWASLEFMSQIPHKAHNVPKFFGGSKAQRFILIEDLGAPHVSLVDSLTLPDKDKAIAALTRFMQALGSFHAATFDKTSDYQNILKKINPEAKTWEDDLKSAIDNLLPKLVSACELLGLTVKPEWKEEAIDVIQSIFVPGPFTVLTHGDICPDNVFDHEDSRELQLIDFEWAAPRNALRDGTYLRMSMPTCWCAKAIPSPVIEELENIYRQELQKTMPAALDDTAYEQAYTNACAYWVLRSLALFEEISEADRIWPSGPVPDKSLWKSDENFIRPRIVSRLLAFNEVSAQCETRPHLREMTVLMMKVIETCWPDFKYLDYYPAFS